jgi:alpha-glucosidase
MPDTSRFIKYLRPDEMHTAFNFDFMARPWRADELRASIDSMLAAHAPVGAPSTWVLSNHDVTRPVTRYGRNDTSFAFASKRFHTPTDVALGQRRARAAALLSAALPGSLYVYQGDELGLPEAENIPVDQLQDPMYFRSGGLDPGRDGCRVPLPWAGTEPPYGFQPEGATGRPWLPQPDGWAAFTVEAEAGVSGSMLSLYRTALSIRRSHPALGDGTMTWIDSKSEVLAFSRGLGFVSVTNLSDETIELPSYTRLLLTSEPLIGGKLPPDSTAWLRIQH